MRTLKQQILDLEQGQLQTTLHLQGLEDYCSRSLYTGILLAMAQIEALVDYFYTLEPDKYGKMKEWVANRSKELANIQLERMMKKTEELSVSDESRTVENRDLIHRIAEQESAIDASRTVGFDSAFSEIKVREG